LLRELLLSAVWQRRQKTRRFCPGTEPTGFSAEGQELLTITRLRESISDGVQTL